MDVTSRRLSESAGMLMIGDGVLGMIYPREHCLLWRGGPSWWRSTIDWFSAHPNAARGFAAAEIAAGLWLARQQEPHPSDRDVDPRGLGRCADTLSVVEERDLVLQELPGPVGE
jgi:hypothetical protein